jgi:hypothetical protein
MVQRRALQTLVLVLILGAGIYGIKWYQTNREDLGGVSHAETTGFITAVQYHGDGGSEVVAFKPDNSIIRTDGYRTGATDRDPIWSPEGNFIYFASDRAEDTFHVYRWDPDTKVAEARTIGKSGRAYPSFAYNQTEADPTMLLTSGGYIMQLNPSDRSTMQILPPKPKDISQAGTPEEGGMEGQMGAIYGQLGDSFKFGRWVDDGKMIAAVMKRDSGEVLILQLLKGPDPDRFPAPQVVTAGDHVDFDVNPKTGGIVYVVEGFQWPGAPPKEMIHNGKAVPPFSSAIGFWQPSGEFGLIAAAKDNKQSFGSPAINPAGDTVAVTFGPYDSSAGMSPVGLASFPIKAQAGSDAHGIARGEIYEPSWDPTGGLLVFARRGPDGKRAIFTVNTDGSSERNVSGDQGNFGVPKFSPQTPSKQP